MKRITMSCCLLLTVIFGYTQILPDSLQEKDSFYTLAPAEVRAVRVSERAPFAKTNISSREIRKANLGQDIPFLLNQVPSTVINSDAGNGVGYTGIRIRGTDATRINVTLNGIPYNDAESQGTFFVDLPDFLSSVNTIQVQRGVGSSSNGAGAYGASINFSTNDIKKEAYAETNNSVGSFNTWKNTLKIGTGLHKNLAADLRFSSIRSDGFIDRASSNLRSLAFSAAWISEKTSLRFNLFSGHEKTYQAWYGISQADLDAGNRTINYAGTEKPGTPYDNETDNYTQNHYQLFFNHVIGKRFNFNTALFYTKGRGFYEQYKADEDFASYGLPYPVIGNDTVFSADFIRQLWLDNHYYGDIFSLNYRNNKTNITLGGSITNYEGNHFGWLTWGSRGLSAPHRWYDLDARKNDLAIFLKEETKFSDHWSFFYDLQFRHVNYRINGFRYNPALVVDNDFNFFNPKAGFTYSFGNWKTYLSYAVANKEPNRDDFEAGVNQQPKPERLHDIEAGIEKKAPNYSFSAGIFYMRYKDQLVLTGKINDVGAYTRTNIPSSYRAGIELQAAKKFNHWLSASGNLAISSNKVKDFTEYIDDYDNGGQKLIHYSSADIAYSPSVIGGAEINFLPVKKLEISLLEKFVSKQYLDNTKNEQRVLDSYFTQDIRAIYTFRLKKLKELNLVFQVNNLLDEKYEPNGYTFSYIYGGTTTTENYYFPMAGRNFMFAVNLKF